ncbi:MAG: hypothetical protein IKJ59_00350 [Clostridia bacterium]|nr:hypothetical protein [Clostridia bacterium]
MFMKNKWFTFQEVLNVYPAFAPSPNSSTNPENWFLSMLSQAGLKVNYAGIKSDGSIIKQADVKKYIDSVMTIVFDRQHDNYIYKVVLNCDEDLSELTEDDFVKAMNKIINVLNLTMPKYLPIIYQYEKEYQDPLRKLESESESYTRHNDTPQNEQDEVDYNTPDYATDMGKSKNIAKADAGSVAERLRELQDKFKSIILEWSNEFDPVFIDEYQLEGLL